MWCTSTPPAYATGFTQYPSEGACAPSTAVGAPPPPPRALDDPPFTPADAIPPPAFASDSFFFFDPPAPMPSGFALPSLDFPPPNPSRLRSAEASIIMSFSLAAFFFSSFSSCAGLALSSPLAFPLPTPPCAPTELTLPDRLMPSTSPLTSCCTGVG